MTVILSALCTIIGAVLALIVTYQVTLAAAPAMVPWLFASWGATLIGMLLSKVK